MVAAAPPGRRTTRSHVAGARPRPEGQAVVLDAPGWKVDSLEAATAIGSSTSGDADLEITSYAAKDYDSYVDGPRAHRRPAGPRAAGHRCSVVPAQLWAYTPDDHTVDPRGRGRPLDGVPRRRGWTRPPTSRSSASSADLGRGVRRRRCPTTSSPRTSATEAAEQILGEHRSGVRRRLPGRRVTPARCAATQGPLPVRRRGGRCIRLRLARGLRERQGPRPGRPGRRGGAGAGDVPRVADPRSR